VKNDHILVALAGQPNCGKSTLFNALTGASQHVANYPGVTVDKKTGSYRQDGVRVTLVDLPGTYSMTSYSAEERVSRDFILHEKPTVTVNVMDASNLNRCLYLTLQLLEMEIPLILNLNMMDVVRRRGISIDVEKLEKLEKRLGIPVVPSDMTSGEGKKELMDAIGAAAGQDGNGSAVRVDYGGMEPLLRGIIDRLSSAPGPAVGYPLRWIAIKLMEGDREAFRLVREKHPAADEILGFAEKAREEFEAGHGELPDAYIARKRYQAASGISRSCLTRPADAKRPLSDRIDGVVCHRFLGPLILVGVIWLLYYLSIVQGYNITNYTWPLLAGLRGLVESLVPQPGFLEIPLLRAFSLWLVDSVNALLNYIPIFLILFSLIAILEDSGYMPRMAFIMDRLFSRYGLHGQSTLPMVLGGIYVGGCAVPGVMSCKGVPDERSRLATILIIPLLNCLAKVPLYVLLINIYFAAHKGLAMFFISTISLLMVLSVSKVLVMTVLRNKETAPFVMEMPSYHLPSLKVVLGRALERVWLFMRKITTIVVAVSVVVFILLQFPGLDGRRMADYNAQKEEAVNGFTTAVAGSSLAGALRDGDPMPLVLYWDEFKKEKARAKGDAAGEAVNGRFRERNPVFFAVVQPGADPEAKKANRAFKKLVKTRTELLSDMRQERIENSFLGKLGRWLEPVSRHAGFNWRVNVALLSAFAAKESSVATLGALYEQEGEGETLEARMSRGEAGFTPLHALSLMLFMVLYPPCLATSIAVRMQAGSSKWMLFSMTYPMVLGLAVATLVFSLGSFLGLTGLQAMFAFYGLALGTALLLGFVGKRDEYA
jgi:ferrous iron transport protein B